MTLQERRLCSLKSSEMRYKLNVREPAAAGPHLFCGRGHPWTAPRYLSSYRLVAFLNKSLSNVVINIHTVEIMMMHEATVFLDYWMRP